MNNTMPINYIPKTKRQIPRKIQTNKTDTRRNRNLNRL